MTRNGRVALLLLGIVAGSAGLAFASVPLYRLFCQITGYGGTTTQAEQAPDSVADRMVTVRFNADLHRDMPWTFRPLQQAVTLRVGETAIAVYRATNPTDRPVVGTATFNVTPMKAGPYFAKIECFCFTEHRLEPGESVDMPVSFFVDPAIMDDRNLDDVSTITLSYTFFRVPDASVDAATARVSQAAPAP